MFLGMGNHFQKPQINLKVKKRVTNVTNLCLLIINYVYFSCTVNPDFTNGLVQDLRVKSAFKSRAYWHYLHLESVSSVPIPTFQNRKNNWIQSYLACIILALQLEVQAIKPL